MIGFLLNGESVQLESERADLTVLDYLRNHRGLTGAKEGCASGDCGACTAVLCTAQSGRPVYQNFNTCIAFVGALHGKQLITVESLKHSGRLHRVQQAMVDSHGSQCGFCTPGFIMSLFAMCKNARGIKPRQRNDKIKEYLAGNLCRCTGYKSIHTAARKILEQPVEDQFNRRQPEILRHLADLSRTAKPGGPGFHVPKTCRQVGELIEKHSHCRLLGGGTDLALEVTQQFQPIDRIIYLGGVAELSAVVKKTDCYEIGAGVTLDKLDRVTAAEYPDVSRLLKRFGSLQIRNQATIGGNVANASPIGDLAPVLIALNALVTLQSGMGRRTLNIEDFFLGYRKTALGANEFIRSITVPRPSNHQTLKIYKVSKRLDDDISAVCMACSVKIRDKRIESVRIACGGMAAIPKRAENCEKTLLGNVLNESAIADARRAIAGDFQPISDVRASAGYRTQITKNLLHRLYLDLASPEIPTRVTEL